MRDQTTPDIRRVPGDLRRRRAAGLVVVLVVAFMGVAIAKPWGSPVESSPTPGPLGTAGPSVSQSTAAIGTAVPAATTRPPVGPSADAFTTPQPPPETATWRGIRWRRLASDDPLSLVRSVLRWRGGFIAVGWDASTTPIWTS